MAKTLLFLFAIDWFSLESRSRHFPISPGFRRPPKNDLPRASGLLKKKCLPDVDAHRACRTMVRLADSMSLVLRSGSFTLAISSTCDHLEGTHLVLVGLSRTLVELEPP